MANYHLSIKVFSRGKGASVIEKAAYRSGEKLVSDYNGELYDYTRKGGRLTYGNSVTRPRYQGSTPTALFYGMLLRTANA